MRLCTREEPDRRCMAAVIVRRDQVDGVSIVELVDLIQAIDDRDVPAEEIDEQSLTIGEHGLEQRLVLRRQMIVDNVDHEVLSLVVSRTKEAGLRSSK